MDTSGAIYAIFDDVGAKWSNSLEKLSFYDNDYEYSIERDRVDGVVKNS